MVQKVIFSFIFILSSISSACDWKTIIKTDQGYLYSKECHIQVGKTLQELEIKRQQVELFKSSSELFKQSYDLEKERSALWYKEAQDLENSIHNKKAYSDLEKVTYFALGVFVMYGAIQAVK